MTRMLVSAALAAVGCWVGLSAQASGVPMVLGWNAPASGPSPTGYTVVVDGNATNVGLPPINAECACYAMTLPILNPGEHSLSVLAYNEYGESVPTTIAVSVDGSVPDPPTNVHIVAGPPTTSVTWAGQDIGFSLPAGSSSYSNGTFTISSAGLDTWGSVDSFHYVWTDKNGDGAIVARVVSTTSSGNTAKAGVQWRETPSAGSRHVQVNLNPNGGVEFLQRVNTDGATAYLGGTKVSFPYYVRLVREGTFITAAVSANGTSWATVGSTQTAMGSAAMYGLMSLSNKEGVVGTSTFDSVVVQ